MMKMSRKYSELKMFHTYDERFDYLKLFGTVGQETFGFDRYLNQNLYHSAEWQTARNKVIVRDNGWDLGIEGYPIAGGKLIVHHMNPITIEDIENWNPDIFNPEYLISVSEETHNAIHYGDRRLLPRQTISRHAGDTKLW